MGLLKLKPAPSTGPTLRLKDSQQEPKPEPQTAPEIVAGPSRDQIITQNPIADFVRARGHQLKPDSKGFATDACPVGRHEKPGHRPVTLYSEDQSWYCHDCQRGGSVIDWLMLERNISAGEAMRDLSAAAQPSRIVATYDYKDEDGKLLFQTVRYEPKNFKQRHPDGTGGWIWNLKDVRRVLYRLPQLTQEIRNGLTIFLGEGEKDVHALLEHGFPATCNPMGAGKWLDEYSATLRNADVVIIADKDKDGRAHAQLVASKLYSVAAAVRVIELSEKDAAAFFIKAGTAEQLRAIAEAARQWTPQAALEEQARGFTQDQIIRAKYTQFAQSIIKKCRLDTLDQIESYVTRQITKMHAANGYFPHLQDCDEFYTTEDPPLPPLVIHHVLHQGSKMLLGGNSKGRKTWALMDLAISVACGADWWGFHTRKGPVCYINLEIQPQFYRMRFKKICEVKGVQPDAGMFWHWPLRGHAKPMDQLIKQVMEFLQRYHFVLVIIDPIYKTLPPFRGSENDSAMITQLLNEVELITVETGAAVLFCSHFSKGNQADKEAMDRVSGSGAWARDPDSLLMMTPHEESDCFTVEGVLRNLAPLHPFVVKWDYPLFVRESQADPDALKRTKNSGQFNAKYNPQMILDELSVQTGTDVTPLRKKLDRRFGMSKATFYRLVQELIKSNQIKQVEEELFKA